MSPASKTEEILQFWFMGATDETTADRKKAPFSNWFKKDKKFDDEIKQRFEGDILNAGKGKYSAWEEDIRGRLALIILFDQFTRNIYRNTAHMYACDAQALALTLRSLADGQIEQLELIERTFLLMPLMHTEDLAHQKLSVRSFQALAEAAKTKCPHNVAYYEYSLNYAVQHRNIVAKFGRFPHRNVILGRESTPAEVEFLKSKGSSF